ncbi:peptide/nickel transport system substrate-binding protein [Actinomadura meyerae]|uniref:Peptide/nickel transport system substrate-binding protein n=1 Tax=Actinomadura meyerae TaxID=240840 RepID=A0A239NHT8_9ACTN|nr:ABC transporter substrate-binding protein [Actinomadura meyerae]SNT53689.1 peptide/nickel transport system substrate-binding protein [Actinomadura meyerae]
MIPRPSRPARVVLAAGIAVVLSSAGCASGGGSADAGRGFVFATDMEPDCLDPQYSALDVTATVDRPIFDSLVAMSSDGRFHPWLAERWTAGRDGRSYTFTLRRGVRFHDGTPLDAAAVKATLDHAVDPKTKSRYAASLIRGYRGSDVVSPTTVRVRLDEPNAAFLQALSTPYLGIQSPASIEKNARGLCGAPVGSGPFRFVGWTRSKSITLARNPGYSWGPATAANRGAARIPRLTFRIISENSVRLGALTSGEVHAIDNVPALNMKTLERSSSATVKRAQVPGAVFGVFLNGTKGVLADERVRVALQRSLDMDAIVKSVYMGRASRAWSLLSPATVGYEPKTVGSWPYDPALSARLLDQAGWTGRDAEGFRTKDGRRLTLRWPYQAQLFRDRRDVLAQAIQAQAKRVGIHVDLRSVDAGTLTQQVLAARDRMDVMGASFVRPEPDILRYFYAADRFPGKGGGNFFRYTDGKLDGWLTDAAESTDPDERRQIYSRIQLHLNAHALVIPTYVPERVLGVSKKVAGLGFDASATPLFHEASLKP